MNRDSYKFELLQQINYYNKFVIGQVGQAVLKLKSRVRILDS